MKKTLFTIALAAGLLIIPQALNISAENLNYKTEILKLQPDLTEMELSESIRNIAETTEEKERAYKQIYDELIQDRQKGLYEAPKARGGSEGAFIVGNSAKGDFYYTPSTTAYLDHGHVGLYYTSTVIVESIPSTGVRQISATSRTVDQNAVVKSIDTTTANKAAATQWAYDELGKGYSYNFATNRLTGHDGDKNCSKLIWSAYLLKAGLDLDVDKGLGVYPRDVRDATQTTYIRSF
ncbi:YiiX/YebB-like N1pC/P60 family cysteine hydrolase [Viridibacillus sp. NPDC096237]|uniref:YiiX/YebB-like N1pC/P60 family cysteine hydrolase n=1 Tax=Viridibacillus sp. NPDC096237 TaxID=3390721 RepID=UPI003D010D61